MPFIMKNIISGQIKKNKNGLTAAIHSRASGKAAYATAISAASPRPPFNIAFISHFIVGSPCTCVAGAQSSDELTVTVRRCQKDGVGITSLSSLEKSSGKQ